MDLIIKKGNHRPSGFRLPRLYWKPKIISAIVSFDYSCKYDIGADQEDWNKLFGVGYLPHHHKNSVRYGWRYSIDKGKIEIGAYWYVNGERYSQFLFDMPFNSRFELFIEADKKYYTFYHKTQNNITSASFVVRHSGVQLIAYRLGLFFGGNKPSQQDLRVYLKFT